MGNQVVLTACIVESNAIRYTPAGLPALDLRLEHESKVTEAGQLRDVRASVKAVAFGSVAERLVRQAVGSGWRFTGFLATPRNGKQLVLHIQEFQPD
ncbi:MULTISPECIES: primosomal replication protein N [Xylophilus]|uniref:Replication restart protein PriB n=1 Tax=Xylophilus ampelinus TaxID=54067 RepID=A0A318SJZ3_9BURK|nr:MULTISPECIES: primosomal replication protein N [Xylophilus]KQM68292.1 single-stranded DNA-binding protein [Xylophilus sp. Leaf220]MCS4509505.1 primosomal replication protein N [Xylophilus ampelinus]PYE79235.1 restart primosome assembly protein PriB [Xylophilus ampelinus]